MTSFLDPLRHRLTQTLSQFNRDLPRNPHVHLATPAANEGCFQKTRAAWRASCQRSRDIVRRRLDSRTRLKGWHRRIPASMVASTMSLAPGAHVGPYEVLGARDNLQVRIPDGAHSFPEAERRAAYEFMDRFLKPG